MPGFTRGTTLAEPAAVLRMVQLLSAALWPVSMRRNTVHFWDLSRVLREFRGPPFEPLSLKTSIFASSGNGQVSWRFACSFSGCILPRV